MTELTFHPQVLVSADWLFVRCLEKDIEVNCLDSQATAITEGGVIANCAFQGLTRTTSLNRWLFELSNVLQVSVCVVHYAFEVCHAS